MSNIKNLLIEAVKQAQRGNYRSTEGFSIFSRILESAQDVAKQGRSSMNWPESPPFIKSKGRDGDFAQENLPDLYLEVMNRLQVEELKVNLVWVNHTSYGSGAYGEDEYSSGLQFVISWAS